MTTVHPTTCPLDCPDACGVLVESDQHGRFSKIRGNPAHSYSRGVLCGKTMLYGDLVTNPDRLTSPLVRRGKDLVPASWDAAIGLIAERTAKLRGEDILALSYAGTMGLVQRKFPLRMMHALGATLHDGGICDSTSTAGYEAVLGEVVGPDIEEIESSDLVVIWGSDVARTVQHVQPALQRMAKRGVPIVAIDIYRTDTMRALERWGGRGLVIRPGTDAALALCLARIAFELDFADRRFLAEECHGALEFEAHVRAGHDLEDTARVTGLEVQAIAELASVLQRARAPFIKVGVGWTRRRNGGMSMRAVCSLAAVIGAAHRVHYESFAHFGLPEDTIIRPDFRPPGSTDVPVKQVALGRELSNGRFRAVFVWCHNPAVTLPDSNAVKRGLARDDLFLVVHEHFLTETAVLADVVLPATMFVEHTDVYRSYGHRVMQLGRAAVVPPAGVKSNVETFSALARALGLRRETWDVTAEGLCAEFLEASRARLTGDEVARLERGEPVKVGERARVSHGTETGKVELWSPAASRRGELPMATYVPDDSAGDRGAFWLVAAPSIDTHNSTYSHNARHLKRAGPPKCHMNAEDARRSGFAEGAVVVLSNARGALTLPVALSNEMPPGLLRVDGLPRAHQFIEGIGVNALTSSASSDLGDGNVMYSARVDVIARSRP